MRLEVGTGRSLAPFDKEHGQPFSGGPRPTARANQSPGCGRTSMPFSSRTPGATERTTSCANCLW